VKIAPPAQLSAGGLGPNLRSAPLWERWPTGQTGHKTKQDKMKSKQTQYWNVKHVTKIAFLGAIIASFATNIAFADNPQLQERLSLQRAMDAKIRGVPTIGVYSNRNGLSNATDNERPVVRLHIHMNAHGQTFAAYESAK